MALTIARQEPAQTPTKLMRLPSTPDYIPTLTGAVIETAKASAVNDPPDTKSKNWGRIRNVAEIRENVMRDAQSERLPVGLKEFQVATKILIKSKKVARKVRSKYSAKRLNQLQGKLAANSKEFEEFDSYNLVDMHNAMQRKHRLKLALLQKKFLDELPKETPSIKDHLERKIKLLEKIKGSHFVKDTRILSEGFEDFEQPGPSSKRQSKLRRSVDFTNCPPKLYDVDEDIGMTANDVDQMLAVAKSREKIEAGLSLPADRIIRLSKLRENVEKINKKFHSLLRDNKAELEKDANNADEEKPFYAASRFVRPGMAKIFFRKYSRIVLIVLQWINMIMNKRYDFERELKSFVDIANEIEDQTISSTMSEMGLSFDKKYFKANREISLSSEARKILTTRWQSRTPQMIKQVMNGLHSLRSLSEYPIQTQEKLCKVAWYQTIGPKKLIVRQGHHAESFYFILSGTAFVKKMVQDPVTGENKAQVAARLTKGHSFGFSWEEGEIGLLFDTLRTATVESSTPMELLVIGKEDFVRIFMKAENPDDEADHIKFLRNISFLKDWPFEALKVEPGACLTHYFKRGTLVTDNDRHSEWIYFVMSGTCISMKKLKAVKPRNPKEIRPKSNPLPDVILPELGMPQTYAKIDSGRPKSRGKKSVCPEVLGEMTEFYESIRRTYIWTPVLRQANYVPSPKQLSAAYRPKTRVENPATAASDEDDVFIQVENIHRGESFGLNTLRYMMDADDDTFNVGGDDDVPILSLVSRGAEVVMLSKKIFIKYADQKCRLKLREKIRVYPSESNMQDNMQLEADWALYKHNTLTEYLARRLNHHH